jgi:3-oxoacyl-[acyl-carrier-protein] synthase II
MRERVAVTGIGCLTSLGFGRDAFVDALLCGRSGIGPINAFDTSECRAHLGGVLRGFDPAQYIEPNRLRRIDHAGRLAIAAAKLTLADSGFTLPPGGADDAGIVLGTYTAGLDSTVEYLEGLVRGGPIGVPALLFSNTVANAPASLCGIELGLRGPNITMNEREASSLSAIAYAAGAIASGRVRALLTGGVDSLERIFFVLHDRFGVPSPLRARKGSCREEASRPYDRRRNGMILGEGAFTILLEPLSLAASRGAPIYGELLGIGATSSPTALNGWPSGPAELARAMSLALEDAGLAPDEVSAVFGSADSTPELDRLEARAIDEVFAHRDVPVVSIKGALGEFGATGAASLVAALLSLPRGVVPPTVGFAEPDPECAVSVSGSARPIDGSVAIVNSFASGGANYSMVVRASRPAG